MLLNDQAKVKNCAKAAKLYEHSKNKSITYCDSNNKVKTKTSDLFKTYYLRIDIA